MQELNYIESCDGSSVSDIDNIILKYVDTIDVTLMENIVYEKYRYNKNEIFKIDGIRAFNELTELNNTWDTSKYLLLKQLMEAIRKVDSTANNLYTMVSMLKYLISIGDFDIHKSIGVDHITPYEHALLINIPIVSTLLQEKNLKK